MCFGAEGLRAPPGTPWKSLFPSPSTGIVPGSSGPRTPFLKKILPAHSYGKGNSMNSSTSVQAAQFTLFIEFEFLKPQDRTVLKMHQFTKIELKNWYELIMCKKIFAFRQLYKKFRIHSIRIQAALEKFSHSKFRQLYKLFSQVFWKFHKDEYFKNKFHL